jgi:biopolymer transport protein ExbB
MNLSQAFEQGNGVLIAVFVLLIGMSIASWYIIFWKAMNVRKERKYLAAFKANYIKTPDWPRHVIIQNSEGGVATLVDEANKLKSFISNHEKVDAKEILTLHLCQRLDLIRTGFDKGLTLLASVGSSAPFIGLFGTVWGIYGALAKIAMEGNAGLSVVAGPMGEALVATAVGLFAAIPAVLAYNTFVRVNRLMVQDLRHIAEQLATYFPLSPSSLHTEPAETVRLVKKGTR